jgi:hypothetical protein
VEYGKFKSLMESLGIADSDFNAILYGELVNVDRLEGNGLEFAVSVIKGIKPTDQLEVMLAAQMAVMFMLNMKQLQQLRDTMGTPEHDSAGRTVAKLARTYTDQMGALKRYRTGGEQKVTVQHVSVNEGGQAIVGNVTHALKEPADRTPALTNKPKPPNAYEWYTGRDRVPAKNDKR